jgi:hypothetical protein
VSWALSAAYGVIALLGHGLHGLTPDQGHHHGLELVQCAVHGADHHHAQHRHGQNADNHKHGSKAADHAPPHGNALVISAGECVAQSHACEICTFLSQTRATGPQMSASIFWQHIVHSAHVAEPLPVSTTSLDWHAPRGPPRCG